MKIRLLLPLVGGLLLARTSVAQTTSWCSPGAEWKYSFTVAFSPDRATVTMRYAGDTIVGGQSAQLLRRSVTMVSGSNTFPPSPLSTIITRTAGSNVSFWYNGQFVPLYQFGAQPGATWTTYATTPYTVCAQAPVQVTVDSVGTQMIGGRLVRWQAIHTDRAANNVPYSWRSRIYEGIGSLTSLQPQGGLCGGTDPDIIGGLLSFRAPGWPVVGAGSSQLVLANAEAQAQQAGFAAYPNPTTGRMTLELPTTFKAATLAVRDLTGRQLLAQPAPATGQLDLSSLPKGLYFLTLTSAGQPALSRRVVVQ
jgi:hypothetical protein